MSTVKTSIFEYMNFRTWVQGRLAEGPRGLQSRLARAMGCQATYLIRVLKGTANMTEDQAYRGARFFKLNEPELEYFLDLVRLDRAADSEVKDYLRRQLARRAQAALEVKNRISASPLELGLESQIRYYSNWQTSLVHLAVSCPDLQTLTALAKRLSMSENKVQEILEFLNEIDLVTKQGKDRYRHNGNSIHLAKESPLHKNFQKLRRELVLRRLEEKPSDTDLHFSSAFATSREHLAKLKADFLRQIETSHAQLTETASEDVAVLVVDFLKLS